MQKLTYTNSIYQTIPEKISLFARAFPDLSLYSRFLNVVFKASSKAKRDKYTNDEWCISSYNCLRALEKIGVEFDISGIQHIERLETPCVIIGNHMSVLETVVLPVIIQPVKDVTFIVKESLLTYPVFGRVMRSRDPIAVTRTNPRQDLKSVLDGGLERLQQGVSIIVFPQTTRTHYFDPEQFSTIGVKLAQKANVPIIPLALKSDAWGNGKRLKDFGKMNPSKRVHFAFDAPIRVQSRGTEEHEAIIQFITTKLDEWRDI
ncbi:1-acyl-sn-glycerol-3-phosphate acyltransferase [candidate division KSB1 bacterium]|nr:1-acyl-sn-glycerol-3-phosphate acyltransferase [candidate division KSB1 bacterium]